MSSAAFQTSSSYWGPTVFLGTATSYCHLRTLSALRTFSSCRGSRRQLWIRIRRSQMTRSSRWNRLSSLKPWPTTPNLNMHLRTLRRRRTKSCIIYNRWLRCITLAFRRFASWFSTATTLSPPISKTCSGCLLFLGSWIVKYAVKRSSFSSNSSLASRSMFKRRNRKKMRMKIN